MGGTYYSQRGAEGIPMASLRMAATLAAVGLFAAVVVLAADPDPLQDFCVAVPNGKVAVAVPSPQKKSDYEEDPSKAHKDVTMTATPNATEIAAVTINVNGAICKDPKQVVAEDFLFKQLVELGDTNNMVGSKVTAANVGMFFGLNTLGISMARIDFAKYGVNPPHIHPRASEVLLVAEGSLKVGFVDTNNKLFQAIVNKGELFVFPRGLLHFQENIGQGTALAFAALSSHNPGTQQIAPALFAADPPLPDYVLKRSFGLEQYAVDSLQKTFSKDKESAWSTEK